MRRMVKLETLKRGIDTLLMLRLHIVAMMFFMVYSQFPFRPSPLSILISACFASLFAWIYIDNKTSDLKEDHAHAACLPIDARDAPLFRKIAWACLLWPAGYLIVSTQWTLLVLYVLLALLGYGYNHGFGRFRLKQHYLAKNLTSAVAWALAATFAPLLALGGWEWHPLIAAFFAVPFIIVLSIEILWDIRDADSDKAHGIHTLANSYGIQAAKFISILLLNAALFAIMALKHQDIFLVIMLATSMIFTLMANERRGAYFYQALLLLWLVYFIVRA